MCGFAEIFSGAGALVGGIQQAQAGRAQAAHYGALAESVTAAAKHAAARQSEQNDLLLGQAKANAVAGGLTFAGSTLDAFLARSLAARAEEEDIRFRGLQQAAGHGSQAAFTRADARARLTGSAFGAGTSLLAAAEDRYGKFLGII